MKNSRTKDFLRFMRRCERIGGLITSHPIWERKKATLKKKLKKKRKK